MREFHTAAQAKVAEEADDLTPITFKHDGTEVTFNPPTPAQYAVMMAANAGGGVGSIGDFIAAMFEMMDDKTRRYFKGRLLRTDDPFDLTNEGGLMDVWQGLAEEWSARPTKQPSDFTPSRASGGRSSTVRRASKVKTSSTSRPTASATSSTTGQSSD